MKNLPPVDVVIVGGGWTGLLMAKELGARTSASVVVLERGGLRKQEDYADSMDELDYAVRYGLMQDYSKETATIRHTPLERAIPIRQLGSFLPGTGIGGAGEHWSAHVPRYLPDSFEQRTRTLERYGPKRLPEDDAVQDWGITWNEIEPYYTRVDRLLGSSGKAGNIKGKIIEGGNIFEGPRSEEYPTPPTKTPYFSSLFEAATKSMGYHPYPNPGATTSQVYTNPDGVTRLGCFYCGYCEFYGCMVGAKAQPTNTLMPVIEKQKGVSIRTGANVRRIVHDVTPTGRKARGVVYIDENGEESFQPADLVFLASWTLNNTRLLLLSGVGEPYDPATGKGTLGRSLDPSNQLHCGTRLFREADEPVYGFRRFRNAHKRLRWRRLRPQRASLPARRYVRRHGLRLSADHKLWCTPAVRHTPMGFRVEEAGSLLLRPERHGGLFRRAFGLQDQLHGFGPQLQRLPRRSAGPHDA